MIKNQHFSSNQDEAVKAKIAEMEEMVKKYIISQLSLVDSMTYKIPSQEEIESMNLDDLSELGKYANVPFDYFLITRLRIEKIMKHSEDEPEWKKINTLKDIESINKDILKYVNCGK